MKVKDLTSAMTNPTTAQNVKVRKVKTKKDYSYGTEYIKKYYRIAGSAYALVVHSSRETNSFREKKEKISHVSFEEEFSMGLFKTRKLSKIFALPKKVVRMFNSDKDLCRLLFIFGEKVKKGEIELPMLALHTGSNEAKKTAILKLFAFVRAKNALSEYQISNVTCWEFAEVLKAQRNFNALSKYLISLTETLDCNYIRKTVEA